MPVTVNVNNLSLVHKGSNGVSTATIPDVCKTPSPGGPVPMPYPNVSMSSDLAGGSTTVKADGNMAAVKGCSFALSTGDEAGSAGGGVKSSKIKGKSEFILYSFDVKLDGKNACRLTDKKTHNDANTVNATGTINPPVVVGGVDVTAAACECIKEEPYSKVEKWDCDDWLKCTILGSKRHACVNKKLADKKPNNGTEIRSPAGANYDSDALGGRSYCRPDMVVVRQGAPVPPNAGDMEEIIDFKFQCNKDGKLKSAGDWDPDQQLGRSQKECYQKIKGPDGKTNPQGTKVRVCGPTSENCDA